MPTDPAARERLLEAIAPDAAREHHASLRALLEAETRYRAEAAEPQDYYENLYWCAFLLYCVGDPADVPALWRAKHVNFDTGSGLDVQALFGAGVDATFAWLRANDHVDLAEELGACTVSELDLPRWRADRERYFSS